jgi:hypothetical protein
VLYRFLGLQARLCVVSFPFKCVDDDISIISFARPDVPSLLCMVLWFGIGNNNLVPIVFTKGSPHGWDHGIAQ